MPLRLIVKTIKTSEYGSCHVSAYTHAKGAMISTPNRDDQNYGGAEWHKNDHLILFRDVGDGRCIVYINEIEPLFARRTSWSSWGDLARYRRASKKLPSADFILKFVNT